MIQTRPWIDAPDASIDAYVNSLSTPVSGLAQALAQWRSDGVVIFRGALPGSLVDLFREDFAYLRSHSKSFDLIVNDDSDWGDKPIASFPPARLEAFGIRFVHIHTISKAAILLSLAPAVTEFLTHVFRAPPCILQSLTFFRGSQQAVHADYPYVNAQTKLGTLAASWVALEDVSPDAGPLVYFPKSHSVETIGTFDWGNGSAVHTPGASLSSADYSSYLGQRIQANGLEPVMYCPKKGDVLIWHGALAHGGLRVANPNLTRQAYVTHYTSLEARPAWTHSKDCQSFVANGGYVFASSWLQGAAKLPSWQKIG